MERALVLKIAIIMCFLLHGSGEREIYAAWSSDPGVNVPICTETGNQKNVQATSDGADGAIIVWQDARGGNWDIYLQRVDSSGVVQWTANGVAVATAAGNQSNPQIISDGADGAIVTWEDKRNSNKADIYAQRVDSSGTTLWSTNGVAICAATDDQKKPQLVSDGSTGAIITWEDKRNGNKADIYAQRVDSSGTAQWITDGAAICTAADDQKGAQLVSDDAGGAIVAWEDKRNGAKADIYAQRVTSAGTAQWTSDGVPICTATDDQKKPQLVSDGSTGAIITWEDKRNGAKADIYAQRVDSSGTTQWTSNGVAICTATDDQKKPQLVSDGSSGAIITWEDRRNANRDIYAQRVDSAGAVQWTVDGVVISGAAGDQKNPQIVTDGATGAIITWEDHRIGGNSDIYSQQVDSNGVTQWTADGEEVSTATGDQLKPQLVNNGPGKAIVAWEDKRSGTDSDIYAEQDDKGGGLFVEIESFTSIGSNGQVKLDWTTASETDSLGFNVLRNVSKDGQYVRINSVTIPAQGDPFTGADYSYEDYQVVNGTAYYYLLEEIEIDGDEQLYGPVSAMPGIISLLNPANGGVFSLSDPKLEWTADQNVERIVLYISNNETLTGKNTIRKRVRKGKSSFELTRNAVKRLARLAAKNNGLLYCGARGLARENDDKGKERTKLLSNVNQFQLAPSSIRLISPEASVVREIDSSLTFSWRQQEISHPRLLVSTSAGFEKGKTIQLKPSRGGYFIETSDRIWRKIKKLLDGDEGTLYWKVSGINVGAKQSVESDEIRILQIVSQQQM